MSAFMVDKAHIDTLITAALDARCGRDFTWYVGEGWSATARQLDFTNADEIGGMLWAENLASIHGRYPDTLEGGPVPGPVDFEPEHTLTYTWQRVGTPGALPPVVVLKAIQCYEYQSCEHDGWRASAARAFCEALRLAMISRLPGYDAAPWAIYSPEQVLADVFRAV